MRQARALPTRKVRVFDTAQSLNGTPYTGALSHGMDSANTQLWAWAIAGAPDIGSNPSIMRAISLPRRRTPPLRIVQDPGFRQHAVVRLNVTAAGSPVLPDVPRFHSCRSGAI